MTEKRTPTSYLSDDWGLRKGGDPESDGGIPARENMPPEPQRGYGKDGNSGGYGHSEEVEFDAKASRWDMDNDEVAKGYSKPGDDAGEPGTASYPQAIPDTNVHDRGAGSDAYAREHSATTGRGFDGRGRPKSTSNPGGESSGSSSLVG
jgi:hypothetical protein